jgi:hypothetical protein
MGAGEEGGCGAWAVGARPGAGSEADVVVGASVGASPGAALGSSAGVSSTVLCLPVVQGGMVMNSSKVKTRGLQHFHPVEIYQLTVRIVVCREEVYLSGPHGRLAIAELAMLESLGGLNCLLDQNDRRILRCRQRKSCRSLYAHTFQAS